jgi:Fe-S-cluster containining protein
MFSKICRFLEIQDEFRADCSIEKNKPKICRNFHCGVNNLMDQLIGADLFDWKGVDENAG